MVGKIFFKSRLAQLTRVSFPFFEIWVEPHEGQGGVDVKEVKYFIAEEIFFGVSRMRKGMNIRRILYFLLIESSEMLYLEAIIWKQ
jgi:hypothetical protein